MHEFKFQGAAIGKFGSDHPKRQQLQSPIMQKMSAEQRWQESKISQKTKIPVPTPGFLAARFSRQVRLFSRFYRRFSPQVRYCIFSGIFPLSEKFKILLLSPDFLVHSPVFSVFSPVSVCRKTFPSYCGFMETKNSEIQPTWRLERQLSTFPTRGGASTPSSRRRPKGDQLQATCHQLLRLGKAAGHLQVLLPEGAPHPGRNLGSTAAREVQKVQDKTSAPQSYPKVGDIHA